MNLKCQPRPIARPAKAAFTLIEVLIALTVSVVVFVGIVMAFVQSAQRVEWSSYNLAASNLAMQGLEQARATTWDPNASTPVDKCTQALFPATTNVLDVPISGSITNSTYATNRWTITDLSGAPYPLKMIRVDCTWKMRRKGVFSAVFTNTVATIRAPNQ